MTGIVKTELVLLRMARIISKLFSPHYISFLAFLVLFLFSYLRIMPLRYKFTVLALVYCFTIFLPTLTVFLFRKINGYTADYMVRREPRFISLGLHFMSYVFCLVMMRRLNIPWYMIGIILTALIMMIVCIIVNLRWRLSIHMAGAGSTISGIVAFSNIFGYNPIWWLCLLIIIAGIVGSARIIQQHHSLGEVIFGFLLGLLCGALILNPYYNSLFRFLLF